MATILALNDVITVRLNFVDTRGNKAFNILHYVLKDVGGGPGGLWAGESMLTAGPTIAEAMYDHFKTAWSFMASQDVTFEGVTVQNIYPLTKSRQYTHNGAGGGTVGAIASEALPLQDTATVLKRGEAGGRKFLGRAYLVGLPENGQEGGVMSVAQMNLVRQMATQIELVVPVLSDGWTLNFFGVLFNPKELPTPIARGIFDVDPSDNIIKTQRRRRPGKGI